MIVPGQLKRAARWLGLAACALVGTVGVGFAAQHPNILWLTAEDMSPNLGCYGDAQARTPRLDSFARESVRFTHAFATAPVCSPSRSCLITGLYATTLGTQRLRSQFPVGAAVRPFPELLRAAGYHCSNNVKTDYNLRDEAEFIRAAWDESSPGADWRARTNGQPFFAVFNFMTTHQSRTSVWSEDEFEKEVGSKLAATLRHDPSKVRLPPYYPDTPQARRAWARYHDCITLMDQQAGEILDRLAADGLAEDTIVFFYSDHGMGMPRGKRCLQDSGMRVPLLVRFPRKWAHLAPAPAGATCDRMVSFVDYAPTVLNLCGVDAPETLQGGAFLGRGRPDAPEYVYGARDRVDEAFDVSRSVRDARWLYIRNYMPHLPWMQPETYSDASTFRRELKQLAATGALPEAARSYAGPRRSREELYDTVSDPHQLRNLAGDPEHAKEMNRLRAELRRWQLATRDAGFITEPVLRERMAAGETPREVTADARRYPIERLIEVADAVGDDAAAARQREWLRDADASIRYWAAVGLNARPRLDAADRAALRAALNDSAAVVRIEAAAALSRAGESAVALPVLEAALRGGPSDVALHAARALELLGSVARPAHETMQFALKEARSAEARMDPLAMFVRFSLETALAP